MRPSTMPPPSVEEGMSSWVTSPSSMLTNLHCKLMLSTTMPGTTSCRAVRLRPCAWLQAQVLASLPRSSKDRTTSVYASNVVAVTS